MKENEEEIKINDGCASGCAGCSGCGPTPTEEIDPTITLVDDDGKEAQFKILDVVVLDNEKQYLIVVEAEKKEEELEAVILEIKEDNGEEVYDTVTDEAIADEVFNKYIAQFDEEDEEEGK